MITIYRIIKGILKSGIDIYISVIKVICGFLLLPIYLLKRN